MRYERFLYNEEEEGAMYVDPPGKTGLIVIPTNASELEQCQNKAQVDILEGIFSAVTELFELPNLFMETTGKWHSFFIQETTDGEIEEGVNSPKLSRDRLKDAAPNEVSGAVIDLILARTGWNERNRYRRLHLES